MIYLCEIKDAQYVCHYMFQNENELAAWLTFRGNYEDILRRQRITNTDICRYYNWYRDTVNTKTRDICLIDEYGRKLDVRNYQCLIPGDIETYNKWYDRTYRLPRKRKTNRRQERPHRKNYNYTHCSRYFEPDNELRHIAVRHCNRISRKQPLWNEFVETAENNWKSQKVGHQYMWHKPRHKSTAEKPQEDLIDN